MPANRTLVFNHGRGKQRGVALIVMLVIMVIGAAVFLVRSLSSSALQNARQETTVAALALAKEALIGYAVTYPEQHPKGTSERIVFVPGQLPCPDASSALGNEGDEDPNCGIKGVTVVGYLPWKTLGLPPLRDGWGNCLWYAVSGSFKANPKTDLLNWDSIGQFQVVGADGSTVIAGATAETQPVAVIFSPGLPLTGQNRTGGIGECGGDYDPAHFLDTVASITNATPNSTADGISVIAAAGPEDSYNDRLLWISRDDILARGIEKRSDLNTSLQNLLQETAKCIATYGLANTNERLPWAAQITLADDAPDTYQNDKFNDTANLLAGRIPFHVWDSFLTTGSTLPSFTTCTTSSSTGCRLFRPDKCGATFLAMAGYPTTQDGITYKDSPDGWFEKWKDHLFFAVAEDFKPTSVIAASNLCNTPNSAGRKCLYVDSLGVDYGPYAGIVIFAGSRQTGKTRATLADRNLADNYLEGINATAININNSSDGQFGKFAHAGNDQIVCIKTDLNIDLSCTNP